MSIERSFPNKSSEGPVQSGEAYADRVKEEGDALWARAIDWLTSVSGTNTITATTTAPLLSYVKGNSFLFNAANNNTGAVTININGLGAKDLKSSSGNNLLDAELISGQTYLIMYDGTEFRCLVNMTGSNVIKTIKDVQVFNSSGTWNKPASVTADSIVLIHVIGAGGGGQRLSGGSAGSSRALGGQFIALSLKGSDIAGSSVSVTIGAGGAGRTGSAGQGSAGGATSFGSFVSVPGSPGAPNTDLSNPTFSGNSLYSLFCESEWPRIWATKYVPDDGGGGPGFVESWEDRAPQRAGGTSGYNPMFAGSGAMTNGATGTAPGGAGGSSVNPNNAGNGAAGRVIVFVL